MAAPVANPNVFVRPNVANVGTTANPNVAQRRSPHVGGDELIASRRPPLEENPTSGFRIGGRLPSGPQDLVVRAMIPISSTGSTTRSVVLKEQPATAIYRNR